MRCGRITFEGPTSHPDTVIAELSALVIASKYGEAFPMIGLEACGAGIPVISTDVGSCADFVMDQRFLVAPNDIADMARALDSWCRLTDAERRQISTQSRDWILREHHPRDTAAKYRELLTEAITGSTWR